MEKQYSLYDLVDILVKNPKFLLYLEFLLYLGEEKGFDPDCKKTFLVNVGENIYPVLIQYKDDKYVGIVDDFSYDDRKTLEYPIIELDNKKYLEVDAKFIKKYINTTELVGIDIIDVPFAKVFLNELNSGSILIRK